MHMRTTIKCKVCGEEFTVRGTGSPTHYGVHPDADLSECCSHIQADEMFENVEFIDYDSGD